MTTLCDLYLRQSDGRDLTSLPARERALRREAARRGWTVHRVVIENDLTTGKSRNASAFKRRMITLPDGRRVKRVVRPGFRSILDDLYTGSAGALLAEDLDRVVRDPRDGEDLLEVVEMAKATADSLSDSLKLTNGGTDNEVYAFRGAVNAANKSSKDTGRRVRDARARQAADCIWGGGRRPYGFRPVSNPDGKYQNTRLVIDPAEAEEIRAAADQLLAGVPLKAIARDMRSRDVETVTGTLWTAETLRDVLLRPINAGIVVYQGEETEVRLPGDPILHEDTWRAVVAKLRDPARSTPGRAPCWLGTNLYRCVCGSVMEIQAGRNRAPAYRCAREGGIGDVHVRRNAAAVDAAVSAVIVERLSRADAVDLCAPQKKRVDVKALRRKVTEQEEILKGWARDRAEGVCTRDEWLVGTKAARAKLEALQARLASMTDRSPLDVIVGVDDVKGTWDKLSLGQQRAILAEVVTVTILPATRKGRGFDPETVKTVPVAE